MTNPDNFYYDYFGNVRLDVHRDIVQLKWNSLPVAFSVAANPVVISDALAYCLGYLSMSSLVNGVQYSVCVDANNPRFEKKGIEHHETATPIKNTALSLNSFREGDCHLFIRYKDRLFYDATHIEADTINLTVSSSGTPQTHLVLVRALRNAMVQYMVARDHLYLHAAALKINGKGVLLIGSRRSGKTTQLCELLTRQNTEFISNDRVLLSPDNLIHGLPVSVNLRAPVVQRYFPSVFSTNDPNPHIVTENVEDGDVSVSPARFRELMNSTTTASSKLTHIVFLDYDPDQEGVGVTKISNAMLGHLLRRNQFQSVDATQPFWRYNPKNQIYVSDIQACAIKSGANTIRQTAQQILQFSTV